MKNRNGVCGGGESSSDDSGGSGYSDSSGNRNGDSGFPSFYSQIFLPSTRYKKK